MKKSLGIYACLLSVMCPVVLHAHGLSPTHYPMGLLPILLARESWPLAFMIPIALIAETIILWAWIRAPGLYGNLWRGFILYMTAHVFETGMWFACPMIGWAAPGWTSSTWETLGALAVCLLGGMIAAVLLGLFLYRGTPVAIWRRVVAVASATLGGYLAALAYGLLLFAAMTS